MTRTTLMLMPNQELDTGDAAGPLALSPDGRQVAYVAVGGGRAQLYHRRLDTFESRAIEGTEGARYPFFSPDGEWVGFFAKGKLQRVSMQGGAPLAVCDTPTVGRGATWADDGTIVFDPGAAGLMQVAAAGGAPKPITTQRQSVRSAGSLVAAVPSRRPGSAGHRRQNRIDRHQDCRVVARYR